MMRRETSSSIYSPWTPLTHHTTTSVSCFDVTEVISIHHHPSLAQNASWRICPSITTSILRFNTTEGDFHSPPLPCSKRKLEGSSTHHLRLVFQRDGGWFPFTTTPPLLKTQARGFVYPPPLLPCSKCKPEGSSTHHHLCLTFRRNREWFPFTTTLPCPKCKPEGSSY